MNTEIGIKPEEKDYRANSSYKLELQTRAKTRVEFYDTILCFPYYLK